MQVHPWIIVGSLAGSLTLVGCYDDALYDDLVELSDAYDSETDGASGGATDSSATSYPGVTITDGGADDTAGTGTGTGTGTDTDGIPDGVDGEGLGPDLPPLLSPLRIDGEEADAAVLDGVKTALLEVDASDDRSLESVTFSIDGVTVATLTEPPFAYPWVIDDVIASASHTIRARALDDAAQSSEREAGVSFDLPPGGSELWSDAAHPLYAGAVEDLAFTPKGSLLAAGGRALDYGSPLSQAVVRVISPISGGLELDIVYPKSDLDGAYTALAVGATTDGRIAAAGSFVPADDPTHQPRPWITIFAATGAPLETRIFHSERGEIRDLAVVDDDVIIAGELRKGGFAQAWIARADAKLVLSWDKLLTIPGSQWSSARALALADDGALYIAGTTSDGVTPQVLAASLGEDGHPLWSGPLPVLGEGGDLGEALAISASGELVIGGAVNYEDGQQMNLRWLRPEDGESNGDFTIPSVVDGDQRVMDLAIDHLGRVYITASIAGTDDDGNVVVYKRSSDGGASLWERVYDSADDLHDRGSAIAVDPHGYVYAAGSRSEQGWPRWWVQGHNP